MIISKYLHSGGAWFRINGYGLNIVNRNMHPPLFSVRNKITKEWRVFMFGIQILTP